MMRTSRLPSCMVALHNVTLLDRAMKVTTWGFWAKKKSQWGLCSILHKISNFMLHDPIHDL